MRSAFILGGSGQIGIAIARRLCADGWSVVSGSRSPSAVELPWRHVEIDARKPNALRDSIASEFDLLISFIAFDESDARELLNIQPSIGRIIAILNASVYRNSAGRTLDEANVMLRS